MPNLGATTLANIRTLSQQKADMVNSNAVTNAEWLNFINEAAQEVYGLVVTCYGNNYFTQSPSSGFTFTTDGVADHFALPTDFFHLLSCDLQITSPNQWVSLKRFNMADRNRLALTNSTVPMSGQTVKLRYVPRFTPLANDSDSYDGFNGWEGMVSFYAAAVALDKEEPGQGAPLWAQVEAFRKRINDEAENRDASEGSTISDVMGRRARAMMYRLDGNNIWLIGNGAPGWGSWGDWGADSFGDSSGGWW